jgi:hypothetical protein
MKASSYPKDWSSHYLARPTTQEIPEFAGFGIFSQDNQEIRFAVEKEGKFEFFTAKRDRHYWK